MVETIRNNPVTAGKKNRKNDRSFVFGSAGVGHPSTARKEPASFRARPGIFGRRLSAVRHIAVLDEALDLGATHRRLAHAGAGASVVFTGHVRDHSSAAEGVTHLEYEAYGEHVERTIGEVVDEALARWSILAVSVEHRVGTAHLGEPTVVVGVATAHRVEAFEAARFLIDEVKARAPIWKKEHWPGGEAWSPGA